MDNDTTTAPSQADGDGTNLTPQAGDTPSTTSPVDASHNKPSKTAEDYERMLADLRKENAGHRTKLKKFEDEAKQREEAQLSKEQLLEKQYNDLKTQHEAYIEAQFGQMIDREIGLQAAKAGVNSKHLDKVSRLIDWESIDVDNDGRPTNIAELVSQLVKEMPELLGSKASPTAGGPSNPSRSQTDGNTGEITAAYVADVMSGKIAWQSLTPERRTAILSWQARNPFRF